MREDAIRQALWLLQDAVGEDVPVAVLVSGDDGNVSIYTRMHTVRLAKLLSSAGELVAAGGNGALIPFNGDRPEVQ